MKTGRCLKTPLQSTPQTAIDPSLSANTCSTAQLGDCYYAHSKSKQVIRKLCETYVQNILVLLLYYH